MGLDELLKVGTAETPDEDPRKTDDQDEDREGSFMVGNMTYEEALITSSFLKGYRLGTTSTSALIDKIESKVEGIEEQLEEQVE